MTPKKRGAVPVFDLPTPVTAMWLWNLRARKNNHNTCSTLSSWQFLRLVSKGGLNILSRKIAQTLFVRRFSHSK